MRAAALRTFLERLQGKRASRVRAFTTAVASGAAVAVVVYKALRSGDDGDGEAPSEGGDAGQASLEGPGEGEETRETVSGTGEARNG